MGLKDIFKIKSNDWAKVAIDCGTGPDAYQVILQARDLSVFERASQNSDVEGKQGEALVSALVAAIVAKSETVCVNRKKDDKDNNGPNGEPAFQQFDPVTYVEIYAENGLRNNGPHGEPCLTVRGQGHLYFTFYKDGNINDGPRGEPAHQEYLNGKLVKAERYTQGKRVEKMKRRDIAAYLESRQPPQDKEQAVAQTKRLAPGMKIL